MTCTSVGESSTINISGIPSSPDMRLDGAQELVLGKRLDHGNGTENLVVLDERARLIAVQARHHDVDEHDVRLVIRDFRERIEAIDRRKDLTPLLGEECLGRAANRLTVVDDQNLEALELRVAAGHDVWQLLTFTWLH